METATTHEARARNAKAQALAAVLFELESVETPDDVDLLEPEDWAVAAAEATRRELLGRTASGKVRQVHVPGYGSGDAAATIAAVARILGDLIAHEAEQAQLAAVHGPDVMTADLDADTPDAWCDDDDRAEADCDHNGGWVNGQPPAPRPHADTYERPPARSARDSQGYRAQMARIAPQPETTEADLVVTDPFVGFPR